MDLIVKRDSKRIRKLGLALGGGGARGFALLGALKALEKYNIKFDFVSGTSVGSLAGAFYCAGYTADEMVKITENLTERDIKKNVIPFMPSKTDGIEKLITSILGDINIEDLEIPFCVVAVDIKTGNEVHITKGNLAKAVAGSCAVPAIFNPVEFEDYLLFDGGLQNTIPTNVPKLNGCDATVGIDINSTRGSGTNSTKYFDLIFESISIMMKNSSIRGYLNADVMITPNMKAFKSTSFMGAKEMIENGYSATIEKIPEILALYNKRNKRNSFLNLFKFLAKREIESTNENNKKIKKNKNKTK